jgi:hypothetical protein
MKTYIWGSGCTVPCFLDLGTSWRWVVSFMPQPLYPRGKSSQYPLDRRLSGPQSQTWRWENSWPYRHSDSNPSVIQPLASHYTNCANLASINNTVTANFTVISVTVFIFILHKGRISWTIWNYQVHNLRETQFSTWSCKFGYTSHISDIYLNSSMLHI